MKTVSDIRQAFIDYFASKGHTPVASSSLVPGNDPTLLFTNAGMVPFKDVFLGAESRHYDKAVSSQRCVRAGGKHNDLENVGYTARHHTFFEMLGNFSFGDYFKEDAIRFAWEFLTVELNLPKEKLWITTFEKDDEATDIWIKKIGVDPARVSRIGEKDNFWSMGATGPCGPCSEIFYDHGADVAGGPPGTPEEDGDRYIEIWNLVFMQYNRNEAGELIPLPKPSVDTGMGLERIAAVMQHVHSNYQIDLFVDLINQVAKVTKTDDKTHDSLKVIADHIRSCAFLITDGVLPSNAGRGYVLRRIIRRALRHGYKLGAKDPFFHQLVDVLVKTMGKAYPELTQKQSVIEDALLKEEQRFAETLEKGMGLLTLALQESTEKLSGQTAFKLYDTYGFPVDLTADVAREHGLEVDMEGYESEMEKQRKGSQDASQFAARQSIFADSSVESEFVGYSDHMTDTSIIALVDDDGQLVDELKPGEKGSIVLQQTPFYAESGGQVGDQGSISVGANTFTVIDTQKDADIHVHIGTCVTGGFSVGQSVTAQINVDRRQKIAIHHSATHVMHAALRRVLGDQVEQKGSLVTDDKLRFDFSNEAPMSDADIIDVENQVNKEIRENLDTSSKVMAMDDAVNAGAMALFGEKYGEEVRVLSIGSSIELCGGTHVNRVGDIGVFKIVSESGVAAGIRRVEAVVGEAALDTWKQQNEQLDRIASLVKSDPLQLESKVGQLIDQNKQLQKELTQLKQKMAAASGNDLVDQAVDLNGVKVIAAAVQVNDPKSLRDMADQLRDKLQHAVVVLGAANEGKVSLIAAVTKAESKLYKAGELVSYLAQQVGGKGGGRPDMAQAGGTQPENLEQALATTLQWVKEKQV